MNSNIFEKVDRLEEGQQAILEQLQKLQQGGNQAPSQPTARERQQTIADFIRRSSKRYRAIVTRAYFHESQQKTLLFLALLLAIGMLTSIVTTAAIGLYSTFTLVENIFLCFVISLLLQVKRATVIQDSYDLSTHCPFRFTVDGDGTLRNSQTLKARYRIFEVLSCISAACNILYVWMNANTLPALLVTLAEGAFFVLSIIAVSKTVDFFTPYCAIYYTASQGNGKNPVTIVYHELLNTLGTQEDFEKKFPLVR